MADCRFKKRSRLQGCGTTIISQVENNQKLEIQMSEKQSY